MGSPLRFQIRIMGPGGERIERVHKAESVIGRLAQADIVVANAEVSRRHVTLRQEGDQLMIIDEGSKNGTFLDGVRLPAKTPRVWRQGQSIKLGLAPEKLTLEPAGEMKEEVESPPPVDTQVTKGSIHRNLDPSIRSGVSVTGLMTKTLNTQSFDNKTSSDKTASKINPPAAKAVGGPVLLGDLERRMQEVLARAEAEAKLLRQTAAEDVPGVQQHKQTQTKIEPKETQEEQFEKAKLESQLRELRNEIQSRIEERKTLAREHAQAKLDVQNLQQETERLKAAKTQLSAQLSDEIQSLEKKSDQLQSQLTTDTEQLKQKAQQEAREIVELAKRQAELLVSDAEIKVKNQHDKMQVKITDERLTSELDLADLKLKQVAELKAAQEKLEQEWQKNQQVTVTEFLGDVRSKCEDVVFSSKLDAGLKLRLLTMLEESLHQHFAVVIEPSAAILPPLHLSKEDPPAAPRFTLRMASMAVGGVLVLLSAGLWWRTYSVNPTEMASSQRETRDIASSPAVHPTPAAIVAPTAPVANVTTPVAPPSPPVVPAPPVVSEAPVAPSTTAVPVPSVPPVAVATPVPRVVPPVAKKTFAARAKPVPAKTSAVVSQVPTWGEVVVLKPASGSWQIKSTQYLQSLRLDRRKIKRYQLLEQKFAREISRLDGRNPASLKEQQRLESEFSREGFELLGPSAWAKLMTYRDYFWNKSR